MCAMNVDHRERNREEWTLLTWHFLTYGELLLLSEEYDGNIEPYRAELQAWAQNNMHYADRFARIHFRHLTISSLQRDTLKTVLRPIPGMTELDLHEGYEELALETLRHIQTPLEQMFLRHRLQEYPEYVSLKERAKSWEENPSYSMVNLVYFLFWPVGAILRMLKRRSHEAYLEIENIEYSILQAFYGSLNPEEDFAIQLEHLRSDYFGESA